MPVSFRSINEHSPLSIQEMRERRDTTTSEELTKLQTSLEFQTWRRSTIDWRFIGMMSVAGVLIALLTVLPTRYSRIEGDKAMLEERVSGFLETPSEIGIESKGNEVFVAEDRSTDESTCSNQVSEEDYSVIKERFFQVQEHNFALMEHLKKFKSEISQLIDERNTLQSRLDSLEASVSSSTCPFGKGISWETFTLLQSLLKSTDIDEMEVLAVGVGLVSMVVFLSVVSLYSVVSNLRTRTALAAEKKLNAALGKDIEHITFLRETAEQSVNILEQELQRKIKQLEDAKKSNALSVSKMSAQITPANYKFGNDSNPNSPRIGAFVSPNHDQRLRTPTPRDSPRELPPPPAQIVERYLSERNFVAIELEQMKTWLQLESDFQHVSKKLESLEAAAEEKFANEARLEDLAKALEEQTEIARKAKEALKAVKMVGTATQS